MCYYENKRYHRCKGELNMGKFCGRCGKAIPEGTNRCAACGYDPTVPEVLTEVGDIGIRCRKFGVSDGRFVKLSDDNVKITDGPDCFNKLVWTTDEFGSGIDAERQRDFEFFVTFRGKAETMILPADLSETEAPYKIGAMITDDLMLHLYIGSDSDNLEYECRFLPDEMYSE